MALASEELVIRRTSEPTMELAVSAQEIGYRAWIRQFSSTRTEAEIRHMFEPSSPEANAERLLDRMNEKARIGKFSGVVAMRDSTEVGYAWAADDMSGGSVERFYKRHVRHRRPYAWIAQINVVPEQQRQGIGSAMLFEVLEPFDRYQRPTAYVFDENQMAINWFRHKGFGQSDTAPVPKYDYFGYETKPAMQWRLISPGVDVVRDFILREAELPAYYLG